MAEPKSRARLRRWPFLTLAVAGLTGLVVPAAAGATEQPNFILFLPDQLRPQEVGCYGNTVAQTPNMDDLAYQGGVRFKYAHVGLPVCTPSRACILTGRMPFAVRSDTYGHEWMEVNCLQMNADEITIAEQLNELGYSCGHVGNKWHVQEAGGLNCITDRQGYTFFEGLNSYGKYDEPKYCDNNGLLQSEPGRWGPDVTTDCAISFITANYDRPFYLNVWTSVPHAPRDLHWGEEHPPDWAFDGREDLKNLFSSVSIPLRPNVPVSLQGHAEDQLREYNAMIAGIDQCLGRIRQRLIDLNIDNKTIVIVAADHGSQLGSHATAWNTSDGWEKNMIYEESVLVPLIIHDPRHSPPAAQRDELISLMDLAPTMVELGGGTPHPRMQGDSFAALITGPVETYQARDAVMVQFYKTKLDGVQYYRSRLLCARIGQDRWKYAICQVVEDADDIQPQALFNLTEDPYEQTNLINHPGCQAIRDQLRLRMLQEMQAVDDPLLDCLAQRGDFDFDGDVDQEDFGYFQACLSGSGVEYEQGCKRADLNSDGAVDKVDFGLFQDCVGGANQPPGC